MRTKILFSTFTFLCIYFMMINVLACPLCSSATGEEIMDGIINGSFVTNFMVTLLSVAVFTLIAYVLYNGIPKNFKSILINRINRKK